MKVRVHCTGFLGVGDEDHVDLNRFLGLLRWWWSGLWNFEGGSERIERE